MKAILLSGLLVLPLLAGCGAQAAPSPGPAEGAARPIPSPPASGQAANSALQESTIPSEGYPAAPVEQTESPASPPSSGQAAKNASEENTSLSEGGRAAPAGEEIITVQSGENTILFALNSSQAAKDLLAQLPLEIEVGDFGSNEKIFYPPEKLDTTHAPAAEGGAGTLAYYAPWGDVVMFYDSFGLNGSLYQLGWAVSGAEQISGLSGTVHITAGMPENSETAPAQTERKGATENTMKIQAGDATFTAAFEENPSAAALQELLAQGPLTIQMDDYGSMEKVGPIGQSLPQNNAQTTTGPGDIILYQGNSLAIYYDTNTWNFTRIGRIEGATRESLLAALGSGSVRVTFSLE